MQTYASSCLGRLLHQVPLLNLSQLHLNQVKPPASRKSSMSSPASRIFSLDPPISYSDFPYYSQGICRNSGLHSRPVTTPFWKIPQRPQHRSYGTIIGADSTSIPMPRPRPIPENGVTSRTTSW
nr:hypothetical protein Itr_chr13CG19920 [Ipomoea trifida]